MKRAGPGLIVNYLSRSERKHGEEGVTLCTMHSGSKQAADSVNQKNRDRKEKLENMLCQTLSSTVHRRRKDDGMTK